MSDSTLHPAHPDVELLADHAEELLTPEQSAELTEHLASCAECRETCDALSEVTALLGGEPAPGPMPGDVAARIDAALAAERASEPEAPAVLESPAAPESSAVGLHDHVPARAAAKAPDAAADSDRQDGGEASGEIDGEGDGGADRARSRRRPAGGHPGDNRPRNRSSRAIRMRRMLATLAVFVAAGGIGLAVSRGGDLDSGATSGANARSGASVTSPLPKAAASAAYAFTQSNLAAEVQRLAGDSARLHAGHTAGTVTSTSTSPDAAPSGLPSAAASPSGVGPLVTPYGGRDNAQPSPVQPTAPPCVLAATKQTQPPAVQGLGSYLDVQVFALLYPAPTDPAHTWDVYLVQNSCSAPLVMLHASVPRG